MAELASFMDTEREFKQLTVQLQPRINSLVNYESSPEAAASELKKIKAELHSAKQLLSDMEMSARGIAEPTRRELGDKNRGHKETLASLSKDLAAAEAKFDRSALLGRGASSAAQALEYDKSLAQRERMAQATEKLRGGTNVLEDAHRSLEGAIDTGAGIMTELDRNRETLQRVRGNVGEVSGTLDTARRILRGMNRREIQNKVAVAVFAIVMVGIIAVTIWCAWKTARPGRFRPPSPAAPSTTLPCVCVWRGGKGGGGGRPTEKIEPHPPPPPPSFRRHTKVV
jgi:vesicle transport through interaction with t-SNAREs protein 1